MKKVLVIANLFHASPRIPGIATYLPEYGWEAAIITPSLGKDAKVRLGFPDKFLDRAEIVETPCRGDIFWFWRRIFKTLGFNVNESITEQIKERVGATSRESFIDFLMYAYQSVFAFPDTEKSWNQPAFNTGKAILQREHFDAVMSSFPFPTTHIVASKIKKASGLPWLADFRDTWTENPVYPFPGIRKTIDKILEKKTMKTADAFVTVSFPYAEKLTLLMPKIMDVIPNGFDPENISSSSNSLTKKFTITHTGTIYPTKQDPEKVIAALKRLIDRKGINRQDIEIRFYGKRFNWLEKIINDYGFAEIACQHGTIPRRIALEKQKESQVLMFLNWEDPKKQGLSHLKFFEYLSAQRPILASGGFPGSETEKLLSETCAGVCSHTVNEIENCLSKYYEEYKRLGKVRYHGDLRSINKYSYREMAARFSNILNKITVQVS